MSPPRPPPSRRRASRRPSSRALARCLAPFSIGALSLGALSLGALSLGATNAHAQGPVRAEAPHAAEAEALFLEGREAMRAGDFAAACPKFAESQRLDPSLGTILNLGLCEEQLGDLVSALTHLRAFVGNVPPSDDRLAATSEHLAALERRVPRLDLRLAPGSPPATQLTLDGVPIAAPRAGEALRLSLNPGAHELVAQAPGGRPLRQTLRLDEGQVLLHDVRPGLGAPPFAGRGAPEAANVGRTLGFVGLGVGAAGLITSAVAGGLLLDRKGVIEDHCPNRRCDDEGFGAVGQAQTLSAVGSVSFAVGLVGLAAGAYLLVASPKSPGPRPGPTRSGLDFAFTF